MQAWSLPLRQAAVDVSPFACAGADSDADSVLQPTTASTTSHARMIEAY
jgi:hypothetical protein